MFDSLTCTRLYQWELRTLCRVVQLHNSLQDWANKPPSHAAGCLNLSLILRPWITWWTGKNWQPTHCLLHHLHRCDFLCVGTEARRTSWVHTAFVWRWGIIILKAHREPPQCGPAQSPFPLGIISHVMPAAQCLLPLPGGGDFLCI